MQKGDVIPTRQVGKLFTPLVTIAKKTLSLGRDIKHIDRSTFRDPIHMQETLNNSAPSQKWLGLYKW